MPDTLSMPIFDRFTDIRYAISSKQDGNMSFKYGDSDDVLARRRDFLTRVGVVPEECISLAVGNTSGIHIVGKEQSGKGMTNGSDAVDGEALITDEKGIGLFLLTADCLPAIFYDPEHHAVGLAHLSRKMTGAKLSQKVVRRMTEQFKSDPRKILVGIGPGIQKNSYIVPQPPSGIDEGWGQFSQTKQLKQSSFDLQGYNRAQLLEAGIDPINMEISKIDTATSPGLFSHYRSVRSDEPEGRFATVVVLC